MRVDFYDNSIVATSPFLLPSFRRMYIFVYVYVRAIYLLNTISDRIGSGCVGLCWVGLGLIREYSTSWLLHLSLSLLVISDITLLLMVQHHSHLMSVACDYMRPYT